MMPQEQIEPQHTKSSDKSVQTTGGKQVNVLFYGLQIIYELIRSPKPPAKCVLVELYFQIVHVVKVCV